MLLSAVSVLVVAQSSSEIPEGLMNNPVLRLYSIQQRDRKFARKDVCCSRLTYPIPRNVKIIRAFLGLCSFFRSLVPKFPDVTKPLTQLTRKDTEGAQNTRKYSSN